MYLVVILCVYDNQGFPLSACVIMALFSLILCWMFFVIYVCLLCIMLLRVRCNCLRFLAASMR